jgi:outer membrane protein, heavy metal efflux system
MAKNSATGSFAQKTPMPSRFFGGCYSVAVHSLIVLCAFGGVRAAYAAEPLTEAILTREICRTGPGAKVARALRQRGDAAVSAAHVLPNPSLVLEYQATLGRGSDDSEKIVGLEIPLEVNGRRQLIQNAAAARQTQANAEASSALFETALAFREDYVAALAAQAEADVLRAQQTALEALNSVIQGLTNRGETSGHEQMRLQLQADLHQRTLETVKIRAESSRFKLARWIGREVLLPANALQALLNGSQIPVMNLEPSGSEIQGLLAAANVSTLESEAAHRRWIPDLDLFAGYRSIALPEGTGHGLSLRLGIPLTFFDHGQGEVATADAETALARASAERLRLTRSIELQTLQRIHSTYLLGVERAGQVSARALALQATTQELYAAGEATLTELFEAFRNSEEARLSELRLAVEIARTRLSLMRSAGTLFDPMLDRACRSAKPGVSP